MMALFTALSLFVTPMIAVRSKATQDQLELDDYVRQAQQILSKYTKAPDDAPGAKELRERGIEWIDPTLENIRQAIVDALAADRRRAEAEAAHQHDSDSDDEDDDEGEHEVEEEVVASVPTSVQHVKTAEHPPNRDTVVKLAHPALFEARRAHDDVPVAKHFKELGMEWVDPTPENIQKKLTPAMGHDSSRGEADQQHSDFDEEDDEEVAEEDEKEVADFLSALRTERDGRKSQVDVSMTTPESSPHAYALYSLATALIVVATCWYGGIVVEKLKERSLSLCKWVYDSTDVFNRFKNRQLADALHKKQIECDQLREANGVCNDTIEAMQERLQSAEETISQFEDFKKRASLTEAALNSKVESLHSVAEEFAQNERLLQDHYAQSREISRRKEAELKERLEDQCLISESLNDAVEEMHRLITTMIEANDAVATGPHQVVEQDRSVVTEARQMASLPDVPVDPITNAVQADAAAPDHDAIQRFVTTVYITLFSLPHGYDSLAVLLRDLSEDSGLNGEAAAREMGYGSFEAFLQSPEMAPRILVGALPNGRPLYKVYPTKADLERYVAQQLGTDYGDTKRALARQREENNKLRRQLASTMERVEQLKSESLRTKPALDSSHFKKQFTKTSSAVDSHSGMFPGTDPASRFRPASSTKNMGGPSTSRDTYVRPASPSRSGQALSEDSTPSLELRRHIDELERMVHCAICMDRPKDTAFACGHVYCHECADELGKCTFGCKKQNGKPLTFKYRVFI